MGYCMEMTDNKFIIKKENFENALDSLKKAFIPENMTCYDSIDGQKYPHFCWVNTKVVLESETLEEALEEIRYTPKYDSYGNIYGVDFTGEKYGDEEIFFNALAPYVESGSYIAFEGDDKATWKWLFINGKVECINGKVECK